MKHINGSNCLLIVSFSLPIQTERYISALQFKLNVIIIALIFPVNDQPFSSSSINAFYASLSQLIIRHSLCLGSCSLHCVFLLLNNQLLSHHGVCFMFLHPQISPSVLYCHSLTFQKT